MRFQTISNQWLWFGYKVGWRDQEITSLTWDAVDIENGIVTLRVGETKNDEGRTVYLDDELKSLFRELWEKRKSHENPTKRQQGVWFY